MKFIPIAYSYEEIIFTKYLSGARTARGYYKRLNYGDSKVLALLNLEVCHILLYIGVFRRSSGVDWWWFQLWEMKGGGAMAT